LGIALGMDILTFQWWPLGTYSAVPSMSHRLDIALTETRFRRDENP
jgi:hypothetical protein